MRGGRLARADRNRCSNAPLKDGRPTRPEG
jgi:hypothetical protein